MDALSGVVLVVDDNENNRDMLSRWLVRNGLKAITASRGAEAFIILKSQKVDIILLDIMMPEMSGFDVLERLKTNPDLRNIPVIMISALDDMDSVVKCIELGAEDYLFKPFNRVLLRARIRAILERLRLQEQERLYQQKMASMQKLMGLGTMAAGVAHELSTPLQVVIGNSESLLKRMGETDEKEEFEVGELLQRVQRIHRNAWKCAQIADSLRTYTIAMANQTEASNFSLLVKETLEQFQEKIPQWKSVQVSTQFPADLPYFTCDREQIVCALRHLFTNALDAMPTDGLLSVACGYDDIEKAFWVTVSDTGMGMSDAVQERIFDPFFTTKPLGEGTGLGLSIVLGIVRAHNGHVDVESEPGNGTTFKLVFPLEKPVEEELPTEKPEGRFD